jgi:hypothetical protein
LVGKLTHSQKQYIKLIIIAFFIGSFAFICIYGTNILHITNDSWLLNGNDLNQHYLGWKFYRNSPWNYPIGLINGITLTPISVIYTDSIPIFAVFFKILSPILPETFQYFGIWGILCFILQAIFSILILYKYSRKICISAVGSIILTISPIVLQRMFIHSALAANWLILASLNVWVYRDKVTGYIKPFILWTILLVLSVGVHMYYVPMVFAIMCANFLYLFLEKRSFYTIKIAIFTILISLGCSLLFMWILGGFYGNSSIVQPGLGSFSSNLNTFINSQGHSLILKSMPLVSPDQGEGYGYLGLGVILLLILGGIQCLNNGKLNFNKNFFISFVSLFLILFIYALSPRITFNDKILANFLLPSPLYNLFSIFRATGRFIWPLCYIISITAIILSIDNFERKAVYFLLIMCMSIQIIDISPAIQYAQQAYSGEITYNTTLQHAAWKELGKNFSKVKFITSFTEPQNYDLILTNYFTMAEVFDIADWAENNNLTLNDFYIGRRDSSLIEQDKYKSWISLLNGNIDKDTIYIFPKIPCALLDIEGITVYALDNVVIAISSDYEWKENELESLNWSSPIDLVNYMLVDNGKYFVNTSQLTKSKIMYGPYIPLQPGYYQITIEGSNLNSAIFDCNSNSFNTKMNINILSESPQKVVYNFKLSKLAEDIEFRIIPNDDINVQVTNLKIEKLNT